MHTGDPHDLDDWLEQSIAALRGGTADRDTVLEELHQLSASGEQLRVFGGPADLPNILDDLLAEVDGDLASVLERIRDDTSSDGALPLGPDGVEGADELSPRYTLREMLGKGGMGEVRTAFDRRMRREVALKQLHPRRINKAMLARFLQEAQVTGQLEHPNIVPVYDIGVGPDAAAFFTMKQVQGQPLSTILKANTLTLVEKLEVFKKVCDAVAFAHDRGVIHRDLKPANIMVGAFGQVFVLDWGLAKLVGEADDASQDPVQTDRDHLDMERTSADQLMGTPAYMAPEQARGDQARIGARSDVYALGIVLYMMLTGRRAFPKGPDLLERVRRGDVQPPHRVARVPRPLSSIVVKAMSFDPDDRYATADVLKADVQAWQQGDDVSAHRYTAFTRMERWIARHGTAVAASIAGTAVLGAIALAAISIYVVSMGLALDQARDARRQATIALADSDLSTAVVLAEHGRFDEAVERLHSADATFQQLGIPSERADLTRAWLAPRITEPAWRVRGASVHNVDLSPDGSQVLVRSNTPTRRGLEPHSQSGVLLLGLPRADARAHYVIDDRRTKGQGFVDGEAVLARSTGERVELVRFDGSLVTYLEGPDPLGDSLSWLVIEPNRFFAVNGNLGTWEYATDGALLRGPLPFQLLPEAQARGHYRRTIEVGARTSSDQVQIRDLESDLVLWSGSDSSRILDQGAGWMVQDDERRAIALGPDGAELWAHTMQGLGGITTGPGRVLTHSGGRSIHILDEEGRQLGAQNLSVGPSSSRGHAVITQDSLAALTVADGELAMTWLREGTEGGGFQTRNWAADLAVSRDGWLVAIGHRDGGVELRERETGRLLQAWETGSSCHEVAFDGATVLGACREAGLWAFAVDGRSWNVLDGDPHLAQSVAVAGGRRFVGTREGLLLRLAADGTVEAQASIPGGRIWDIVTNDEHVYVASRSHAHPLFFAFTHDLEPIETRVPHDAAYRLATLPNGGVVASSHRGVLRRVDAPDGPHRELDTHTMETVMAVAASPDGTRLAIGRYDGSVEIFDLEANRTVHAFPTHPRAVIDVAWPDVGPVFLTGGGVVETLDARRPWPKPLTLSFEAPADGVPARHLVRSAMAADAWAAVASLTRSDPNVLDALTPEEAVRAAFVAGDAAALDRAAQRTDTIDPTTLVALRAALR